MPSAKSSSWIELWRETLAESSWCGCGRRGCNEQPCITQMWKRRTPKPWPWHSTWLNFTRLTPWRNIGIQSRFSLDFPDYNGLIVPWCSTVSPCSLQRSSNGSCSWPLVTFSKILWKSISHMLSALNTELTQCWKHSGSFIQETLRLCYRFKCHT